MKRIKQFIIDNELDFTGTDSDLNSNCCILAGFALYATDDINDFPRLAKYLNKWTDIDLSYEAKKELERVYDYAYSNNYAEFWKTNEANEEYIF